MYSKETNIGLFPALSSFWNGKTRLVVERCNVKIMVTLDINNWGWNNGLLMFNLVPLKSQKGKITQ